MACRSGSDVLLVFVKERRNLDVIHCTTMLFKLAKLRVHAVELTSPPFLELLEVQLDHVERLRVSPSRLQKFGAQVLAN
eukprot:CAMPEP_0194544248 /NCGR_PEP_ID=MMETSP0253-20130528/87233_1 /TAXON_ID=2966 /ORGANISM="Noctiluca scintillans" /LENGTH=78 /DNA_ID=CAMNT_0039391105 /DNA_START=161 /DNA_END=394 /DNA_ORIENTATION=-